MSGRHILSWKSWYYSAILPALRRLGPERADAALGLLGRSLCGWRGRRDRDAALLRARAALGADWDIASTRRTLAAEAPRFLARDLLLDGLAHADALARFDVSGFDPVQALLAEGRGVVLLGSHYGAHLSALHWLDRQGVDFRMLVQRPKHLSRRLRARFDAEHPRFPQRAFDLRRGMPPDEAARRVLVARDALRAGLCLYLNGDISLPSPGARTGRFLGRDRPFLAVWSDLARLARVPVVPLFCTHQAGGRYRLIFEPAWETQPGAPEDAVARYLQLLERHIAADPSQAVLHLG
jgi:lauroyl/myristoyl acyltransferase